MDLNARQRKLDAAQAVLTALEVLRGRRSANAATGLRETLDREALESRAHAELEASLGCMVDLEGAVDAARAQLQERIVRLQSAYETHAPAKVRPPAPGPDSSEHAPKDRKRSAKLSTRIRITPPSWPGW
jgi:hypothetical protein